MTNKTMTCKRCQGKGLVSSPVMNAGIPGGCFKCNGRGWVYADKFLETLGDKGEFLGVSYEVCGSVCKSIQRGNAEAVKADSLAGTTVTVITENQARAFFAKYGTETTK